MQKAVDRRQAVLGVDFLAQLVAAAEPLPGQELAGVRAERHGGEERERGVLARVIAGRRPAGLDRSLGHRIEALKRRNKRIGLEELDAELASGHALDVLAEAHAGRPEVRQRAREGALHLPLDLRKLRLRLRLCRQRAGHAHCDRHRDAGPSQLRIGKHGLSPPLDRDSEHHFPC
jgi:hypothetical protein